MIVHAVYTASRTRETDSVCEHNAPGPWAHDLDDVTCEECLRIIRERTYHLKNEIRDRWYPR